MNVKRPSPSRRMFLRALGAVASLPLVGDGMRPSGVEARAIGFLEGTWVVRCSRGHDDTVDGITRNHDCESRGCGQKSVDEGEANVVCPDGHATHVGGVTRTHLCTFPLQGGGICGKQCRR
jgi:hypothetical protein